jgi:hypothetical protein
MKHLLVLLLPAALLLNGCNFETDEELAIKKMIADYLLAVQTTDEGLAHDILLDLAGFRLLNPDVSARMDAGSFTDAVLSDLVISFRNTASFFRGKTLKVKSFTLGGQWYQYKGFAAFKDNVVLIDADGEEVEMLIRGIVKLNDKWRIVDLSDNGLF